MNYFPLFQVQHGIKDLLTIKSDLVFTQPSLLFDQLGEIALCVLHNDVDCPVFGESFQEGDDVGMADLFVGVDLLLDLFYFMGLGAGEAFDGDLLLVVGVLAEIDYAEGAYGLIRLFWAFLYQQVKIIESVFHKLVMARAQLTNDNILEDVKALLIDK